MNKELKTIGGFIIASAIIWGFVIVGCSLQLKGTSCYDKIQNILTAGVIIHLILIWGPLAAIFRKTKTNKSENSTN